MSGVKRTRPDDNPSTQSQTTTTTDKVSPKIEATSPFVSTIEEEYNW
jgi:hypothetical protein